MKYDDIEVGVDYEVGEGEYKRFGRVTEKGTFTKKVYHGRSFTGTPTQMRGVKVHWLVSHGPSAGELLPLDKGAIRVTEWVRSQAIGRKMDAAKEALTRRQKDLDESKAWANRITGLLRTRGFKYASCHYSTNHGFKVSVDWSGDLTRLTEILEATKPMDVQP